MRFYRHFEKLQNLQNKSQTWDTENPTLSSCFEQTVLVYIPCALLWLCSALEIYWMKCSNDKNIKVNFLNTSKLILTALITILTICDLVYALTYEDGKTYAVHYFTPVIKIASFVSTKVQFKFLVIVFWSILDSRRSFSSLQSNSWKTIVRTHFPVLVTPHYSQYSTFPFRNTIEWSSKWRITGWW